MIIFIMVLKYLLLHCHELRGQTGKSVNSGTMATLVVRTLRSKKNEQAFVVTELGIAHCCAAKTTI